MWLSKKPQNAHYIPAELTRGCIVVLATMLVLLFLLQALPAAWSSYDTSCRTITESQCDFFFSANVSKLHSDRIAIGIDRGLEYLRLFSTQDNCWTSNKSQLLIKLDDASSNCHSFKIGTSYSMCVQHVQGDCLKVVSSLPSSATLTHNSATVSLSVPSKRVRRQSGQ